MPPVRLYGTVRGVSGEAYPWHMPFAYVVARFGSAATLAKVDLGPDGEYALEFTPPSSEPMAVELGARAPGKVAAFSSLRVEPGDAVRVDLDLGDGERIVGRVVTKQGEPVPAIELSLSSTPILNMIARVGRVFDSKTADRLLSRKSQAYAESRCVTDERGFFSAEGLLPGKYTIWTTSDRWFIVQDARVQTGATGVECIAVPAVGFELSVRDADTGAALSSFGGSAVILAGRQHVEMPLSGVNGIETFVWAQLAHEASDGCSVELRVSASNYVAGVHRLEFRPGETFKRADVLLRAREIGSTTVTILDASGDPVTLDLVADLASYPAKDEVLRGVVLSLAGLPGVYSLRAPSGTWLAALRPSHELGVLMDFHTELNVAVDGESIAHEMLPSFGSLHIIRAPSADDSVGVSVRVRSSSGGGVGAVFLLEGSERLFPGIPTGDWSIRAVGGGLPDVEHEVRIDPGEVSTVDLSAD